VGGIKARQKRGKVDREKTGNGRKDTRSGSPRKLERDKRSHSKNEVRQFNNLKIGTENCHAKRGVIGGAKIFYLTSSAKRRNKVRSQEKVRG